MAGTEETAREIELESTTLGNLFDKYNFTPRLHSILIGEYVDEETVKPLTLDLPKSVSVICQGASGLGKSTLAESCMLQLCQVPNVQLCAIDAGSGSFDALEDRLLFPICDTPQLAVCLMKELINICNQRKALFKEQERIRTLDQYNSITGANLPYVFLFVDETLALLENKQTREHLTTISSLGRKHGLGMFLLSTSLKVDTLPSQARGNAQCRISFWVESGLSRSMFNSDAANQLGGVGDIVIQRPGVVGLTVGKTPLVQKSDYASLPESTVEQQELIEVTFSDVESIDSLDDESQSDQDRCKSLKEQGFSDTAIARQVFNYGNSFYIKKVRQALAG
jgi:DNA segregation ATPase FtsK/SpoIIIE-like protein